MAKYWAAETAMYVTTEAVQIHGGPPQTVHYRMQKLVHNPNVALAGLSAEQLFAELKAPEKQ